jgi:hypothetical protein
VWVGVCDCPLPFAFCLWLVGGFFNALVAEDDEDDDDDDESKDATRYPAAVMGGVHKLRRSNLGGVPKTDAGSRSRRQRGCGKSSPSSPRTSFRPPRRHQSPAAKVCAAGGA